MIKMPLFAAAALVAAAQAATAAAPSVTGLTPGYSFEEYDGSAELGIGAVDVDRTLFFVDEKAVGGLKSWFVFFDSQRPSGVTATLHFDQPIVAIYSTRDDLEMTTPTYGVSNVSYGSDRYTGLERGDVLLWSGNSNTVYIDWTVLDPGDHIRVITAVPEPGTQAMLAAGLLATGWLSRRRFGNKAG